MPRRRPSPAQCAGVRAVGSRRGVRLWQRRSGSGRQGARCRHSNRYAGRAAGCSGLARCGTVTRGNRSGGWLIAEMVPRSAISGRCERVQIPANLRVGNCPESLEGCGWGRSFPEFPENSRPPKTPPHPQPCWRRYAINFSKRGAASSSGAAVRIASRQAPRSLGGHWV